MFRMVSRLLPVRYCLNAGIFNGNADGTLNPKGNVTRAELAVIINNLA